MLLAKVAVSILLFYAVNEYVYVPLFTTTKPLMIPETRSPLVTLLVHLALMASLGFSATSILDLYHYGEEHSLALKTEGDSYGR